MARIGTFDELMDEANPDVRPIAAALRAVILAQHPDAVEVVRLGDRASNFGFGPKKMSQAYVYVMPHKKHVNLGFYRGVGLPDPEGVLEGTGAKMRHVKVRSVEQADSSALAALIAAARAERRTGLGLPATEST